MSATSSALQLADLALVWSESRGAADLALIDSDLASDTGLETAAVLSLWLDRRAQPDDVPPSGDPNDRRGWWADEFSDVEGDLIGSRLWLLERSKLTGEVVRRAEEYVRECYAWMLEDRVVSGVDVAIETTKEALLIGVSLQRPGREPLTIRFAHVWNSLAA